MLNKTQYAELERQAIVATLFRLCDPLRTMDNFKKGDTVRLKSGGPVMTIGGQEHGGSRVMCEWFDDGTAKHEFFYPEQLKSANPPEDDED